MSIYFKPIWFDSLGAKSSCTLVKTPDISILIDPGVAAMQPSFPASEEDKIYWESQGREAIKRASKEADIIIVSHYHHDHYSPDDLSLYANKLLFAKNPNEYINDSQRKRAEDFYSKICKQFGEIALDDILKQKEYKEYPDPLNDLPIATHKDFGDYGKRKRELFDLGIGWFKKRAVKWNKNPEIPELKFKKIEVKYPEGKEFYFGKTTLRFTAPLFHGIEFSRVGWIFATVIEYGDKKLIHSSDMNGPVIEDYAEWIIKENPNILILDGPMTYMFGYLLNRINLNRAISNVLRIINETDTELIIYDHHLPREKKFIENTKDVWKSAKELKKGL